MNKKDKEFICNVEDALENEKYDDIEAITGDAWDIIERLLKIVKSLEHSYMVLKKIRQILEASNEE
jgi:predicted nucleic acid-binding Zn finger protein